MGFKNGSPIDVPEVAAVNTPAGHVSVYAKPDRIVYGKDAAGVEGRLTNTPLVIGGGSSPPYFDGSTPGTATDSYAWLGTPHVSRSEHRSQPSNTLVATNYVGNPSVESTISGIDETGGNWHSNTAFGEYAGLTILSHAVPAREGALALQATWPGSHALADSAVLKVGGLTVGNTYDASIWVYVPFSGPDVRLNVVFYNSSEYTSLKEAWVRLSTTFVATSTEAFVGVNTPAPSVGGTCLIDGLLVTDAPTGLADVAVLNFRGPGVTVTPGAAGEAVVTMPGYIENQPGCLMYMTNDQTIPHNTSTTVILDTYSYAVPPSFADTSGHALVIPHTGLYVVNAYIGTAIEPAGDIRALLIRLNGGIMRIHREWTKGSGEYGCFLTSTAIRNFNAGDRLDLQCTHSGSGGSIVIGKGPTTTTLEATFIGAL